MMRFNLYTILTLLSWLFINWPCEAQEGTVTSGGEIAGNGGIVSFTVGQIDFIHLSESGGDVRQGIQQPILAKKEVAPLKPVVMHLYPNPTRDFVFLNILHTELINLSYVLTDLAAKTLEEGMIREHQTRVEMKSYASAAYFLTVYEKKKPIKTFKIILVK
ncbi:T9SS type A sorting domain-containing protein [Litoribacter alkaliphilus]|uniref:T9SS type A sorting domain-containing protein n=1 Tax=Litoribacter ruber TaxID=702568 RepID=A0AAP2CJH5_9BACT|nr:T9SS type A sorting domain-containing protein [Litoribacter alkaliphilus]MBS9525898.1 T9SS type A sorting domain-containing protein [Litoribacter alkaliphilus]